MKEKLIDYWESARIVTDKRIIEVSANPITSAGRISLPIVNDTFLPARIAPKKTNIPNKPGIKSLRIKSAPKAAENEGAVPLPPIFIARNMARMKGINRTENIGENNDDSFRL